MQISAPQPRYLKPQHEWEMLFLSLHTCHAQNIFDCRKTIELRKRPVREGIAPYVLFYVCAPQASIEGVARIKHIFSGDAKSFYKYADDLCLSKNQIKKYLGDKIGYGIKIERVFEVPAIPLQDMKNAGILPPQGYRYLGRSELDKLGILFKIDEILDQCE